MPSARCAGAVGNLVVAVVSAADPPAPGVSGASPEVASGDVSDDDEADTGECPEVP